jgi:lambda repressor-like predicted transcriptional regulator
MTKKLEPIDIQYRLKKRGITQRELAQQAEVSEMTVSKVVRFELVSERIFKIVSEAIELDPRQVFAWYYDPANKRRRKSA